MRILVTNDDGIDALGLQLLAQALAESHEVYVVAPDRERSATGHAITMHKPIYPKPVSLSSTALKAAWKVTGTPADCVKLGVQALLEERPDLVLAGINHGSNLGRDIFYSGTVSAALEGMFLGVASFALSAKTFDRRSLQFIAQFVRQWTIDGLPLPSSGEFFNVNFPDIESAWPPKLVWVGLGHREYRDEFHRYQNPRGQEYYWLSGEPWDRLDDSPSDVAAIEGGMIAATPLHMDVSNWSKIHALQSIIVTPPKQADEGGIELRPDG